MKKKRLVAILLVGALSINSGVSVFGYTDTLDETTITKEIVICDNGDGVYSEVFGRSAGNSIKISEDTQYDDIYIDASENQYYQEISDDEFVQVDKVEFELTNYDSYSEIQKYSIPEEVLNGIASMAAIAEQTNSEDAKGIVFVEENKIRSSTLNTIPKRTTTWSGHTFHHYQVYFTDMWSQWTTIAEKGGTTKTVLSAIKDLTVTGAGAISGTLGAATALYSTGKTCLDTWKSVSGKTPIYCNATNSVMVDIKYNIYLKYTYYYDPSLKMDRIGCSSQRAYIKEIDTDTYLYDSTGGCRVEQKTYPSASYNTTNYASPEAIAYEHYLSGWVERVKGKVYNKTIEFTYPSFSWPSDWPSK